MNLLQANRELLLQGIELLDQHDDQSYRAIDPATFGSGIGAHFRHILDHYRSFLSGLETGLVDYDDRKRHTREESDRTVAIENLGKIAGLLDRAKVDPQQAIRVSVRASESEDEHLCSGSSLGRELQFLVSHTVHHYALIAIASRLLGISPDASFGVAPSTLKYLHSLSAD